MHTAAVVAQENAHKEHLREHKEYETVSKAILQLLTNVFEPKYMCYLYNQCAGCNKIKAL